MKGFTKDEEKKYFGIHLIKWKQVGESFLQWSKALCLCLVLQNLTHVSSSIS